MDTTREPSLSLGLRAEVDHLLEAEAAAPQPAAEHAAGPIPPVAPLAAATQPGTQPTASERAFTPKTRVNDDGSTITTGGPEGPISTAATTDRGALNVEHGYAVGNAYFGMPAVFTGNRDADVASYRASSVAWARERRERGINTVGPEGHEQEWGYNALGRAGGEQTQYFGAVHDVQSAEAYIQAMYSGRMREYRAALEQTAVSGYQSALNHGGAAGARLAREMYAAAGFQVSAPEALDVGPPPPVPGAPRATRAPQPRPAAASPE
jgi:hypothetical protein